jgi:hypothetical protein
MSRGGPARNATLAGLEHLGGTLGRYAIGLDFGPLNDDFGRGENDEACTLEGMRAAARGERTGS